MKRVFNLYEIYGNDFAESTLGLQLGDSWRNIPVSPDNTCWYAYINKGGYWFIHNVCSDGDITSEMLNSTNPNPKSNVGRLFDNDKKDDNGTTVRYIQGLDTEGKTSRVPRIVKEEWDFISNLGSKDATKKFKQYLKRVHWSDKDIKSHIITLKRRMNKGIAKVGHEEYQRRWSTNVNQKFRKYLKIKAFKWGTKILEHIDPSLKDSTLYNAFKKSMRSGEFSIKSMMEALAEEAIEAIEIIAL